MFFLCSDDLLSSDEEGGAFGTQHGFVYSIDADGEGFGDNHDYGSDVKRYGKAYAQYKSRIVKKNRITLGSDDEEKDDTDGEDDDGDSSVNSSLTGLNDDYYSD